ncbi:MAG: radical SAM family heme chaperone HemW [Clostridia bacterium]|nr:radical SAM family heme chaperone HemW [Clostridia bacterium]
MKTNRPLIGVYVHIPFCDGKCPYCDFYSMRADEARLEAYTNALCRTAQAWAPQWHGKTADTVYFGGGTPVLLGADRLRRVLESIRANIALTADAEITVEANPAAAQEPLFRALHKAGFNRLSMGLQSADPDELRFLGRRHTVQQASEAVQTARDAGFTNISLDLMLGLQGQTPERLKRSVAFCAQQEVPHVSAYLLKVEPGTPFDRRGVEAQLPDEDAQAELYHTVCTELAQYGYHQYEISNFAKAGFESRHNLHYWRDEEYAALGASAHGFLDGKRFYYPRDIEAFLQGQPPVADGTGGDPEEYILLALRLTEGVRRSVYRQRFGQPLPKALERKAALLARGGLLTDDGECIALTRDGFLVSNAVIGTLLDCMD